MKNRQSRTNNDNKYLNENLYSYIRDHPESGSLSWWEDVEIYSETEKKRTNNELISLLTFNPEKRGR
jgi:hypothetical protein